MKKIITQIKLSLEGFAFSWKEAKKYRGLSHKEIVVRTVVEWCDHLSATNRAHFIKDPQKLEEMRQLIKRADQQRFAARMTALMEASDKIILN